MNHKVLSKLSGVLIAVAVIVLSVQWGFCFDVRPGAGAELFELREMEDGDWSASMLKGVSGGIIFDLEIIPFLAPLFKLSLHPSVEMGEGKFRLAGSLVLGLFPWLDGKGRLLEVGPKKDITGKPEGAASLWSWLIMAGFGWGGGE